MPPLKSFAGCRNQRSSFGDPPTSHTVAEGSFTVHCYKTGSWRFLLVALHCATLTQGGKVDSGCQALRF